MTETERQTTITVFDQLQHQWKLLEEMLKAQGIGRPVGEVTVQKGEDILLWTRYGNTWRICTEDGDKKPVVDSKVAVRARLVYLVPALLKAYDKSQKQLENDVLVATEYLRRIVDEREKVVIDHLTNGKEKQL